MNQIYYRKKVKALMKARDLQEAEIGKLKKQLKSAKTQITNLKKGK